MKFLLFVATDATPDSDTTDLPTIEQWVTHADQNGRIVGSPIAPPEKATTVRIRSGETLISNGSLAGINSSLVGFDIFEAADTDAAIQLLQTHPMARLGQLELRPFQ